MSQELVDGFYGGDELSLVNFSELEPDEILARKYKKGVFSSYRATTNLSLERSTGCTEIKNISSFGGGPKGTVLIERKII